MKIISAMVAAIGFALALAGASATVQADTGTGGHCPGMTITDYFSSYNYDHTASTSFVNVTDARVSFTTSSTGCVVITFAGPADIFPNGGGYDILHVRTLLDGNNPCVSAIYNDVFSQAVVPMPVTANSITRVCKNVSPGSHYVQVQYRSDAGGTAEIFSHVLTVTHN